MATPFKDRIVLRDNTHYVLTADCQVTHPLRMSHFGAGITLDGQGFVLTIAGDDTGNAWPGLFPCSVSCYNMGFDPNNQVLVEGATWLYEKGVEPSMTDCWNVRDPKPAKPEETEESKPAKPVRAKGTFPYQILHTRMSANKRPTL